jgi:hypothetical protein
MGVLSSVNITKQALAKRHSGTGRRQGTWYQAKPGDPPRRDDKTANGAAAIVMHFSFDVVWVLAAVNLW